MTWFIEQAAEFYDSGIQKLVPRLNKCLDNAGDYVEKQICVQAIHSQCRFGKLKMLYKFKTFVSLLSGHASYILMTPFTTVFGVFCFLLTDAKTLVRRPVFYHSSAKIIRW